MDYTGKKLYFTSSTHWDREWYQNFQGFRYRLVQVVDRAIEYLENTPEFEVFTFDGQTIVLEDYLEIRPENRERLEKLISAGRIKIGPWLCMPDEFIPSGESLITNLQIGDRLSRKYGGEQWKYGYICDIFGHTAQMAQIFNGFGIRYALLGRGTRKEELKSHFLWKAPDGSECITYRLEGRGAYGVVASQILPKWHAASEEEKDKMIKDEVDYQFSCTNLPIALITDGIDHADLHPELLDMAERIRRLCPGIEVVMSDLTHMGKDLEAYKDQMPVKVGEINTPQRDRMDEMEVITNTVSSRYDNKKDNDVCQTKMEKWAQPLVLAAHLSGKDIPQTYLDVAYRSLISNHPHDSICGCSIAQIHEDMKYRFAQTREIADEIVQDVTYTHRLKAQGDGPEAMLSIFNPLPYERDEVVDARLIFDGTFQNKFMELFFYDDDVNPFRLYDEEGNEVPYTLHRVEHWAWQRVCGPVSDVGDGHTISFRARLRPGGVTQFKVVPSDRPTRQLGTMVTSPTSAENEKIRLDISADGTLKLTDKQNNKCYERLLSFLDDAEIGDGWFHCPTVDNRVVSSIGAPCAISVESDGPAQCVFLVEKEMRVPRRVERNSHRMKHHHRSADTVIMTVKNYITLNVGSEIVKVKTVLDNNALDHRLRLLNETGIEGDTYFANECFCFVERKCGIDPASSDWFEADRPERAMSGIVGKRGADGCGLAVVCPAGLHECAGYENGRLTVTLLRSFNTTVQTTAGEPEGYLTGELVYDYALVPFGKGEENARLQRIQDCLATGTHATFCRAKADAKPENFSMMQLTGDDAICFSTAKRPLDGAEKTAVVRVYNNSAHPSKGQLTFKDSIASACLCDLLEQKTADAAFAGSSVELTLEPWKIATLRVTF